MIYYLNKISQKKYRGLQKGKKMLNDNLKSDLYLTNLVAVKNLISDITNVINETEKAVELSNSENDAMTAARGGLCCVSSQIDSLKKIMDYIEILNKI